MSFAPSVGDILMLSQLAWKIGRAFTTGKKGAPAEFAEVERESHGLSESLKLVAETLHSDDSILANADRQTQLGVSTILDSARTTLSDLESFVDRYRVIKQKKTETGFVVERAWSEAVLANYRKLKWTTEGGDITELRNMLHMHTNTINLTMQALQSRSLARLERTVLPMADNVASIHSRINGDLGRKIDELHHIIMTIASGTPSLAAIDRQVQQRRLSDVSDTTAFNSITSSPLSVSKQSVRTGQAGYTPSPHAPREDSAYGSVMSANAGTSRDDEKEVTAFQRVSTGESIQTPYFGTTLAASPNAYAEYERDRRTQVPRRESETIPALLLTSDEDHDSRHASTALDITPTSSYDGDGGSYPSNVKQLPPPAVSQDGFGVHQKPATPATLFSSDPSRPIQSQNISRPATAKAYSIRQQESKSASPVISAAAQSFEKILFRNAAILCDVRGTLVEYAHHNQDEPDPRFATSMLPVCKECRVYVIRKRENQPQGGSKVMTSIWVISDDGVVRCQQAISDALETVPYCSYFQPEKVSIPPTEGDIMRLRFHQETWGLEIEKEIRSNWINYLLESEQAANSFQSAIFGRTLLGSFRTLKTSVIHEGIKGAFAFEEQFANIEVLRLWEDDGTAQVGAGGGVLALLHLGSNFGEGWARWWMNSSKQQVRLKDEQTKFAKVKGIDVRVIKPGASLEKVRMQSTAGDLQRQSSDNPSLKSNRSRKKSSIEKRVTGVRIEFKTEMERQRFVELTRRIQVRMLPLPDV